MIKIEYPLYQPRIKEEQGREFIFDVFRKQWVVLTPEEWVRQNFLQYLTLVKKYAPALIAVEKEIRLGDTKKRFDIVVYDTHSRPLMLVECKEMQTALTQKVLDQALRYNITMQVPYLVITNGSYCMAFNCSNGSFTELESIPAADDLP